MPSYSCFQVAKIDHVVKIVGGHCGVWDGQQQWEDLSFGIIAGEEVFSFLGTPPHILLNLL